MEFPCRAFLCACGGRYAPPPHAWGILPYLTSRYVRGRFIPTCVGNTVRFMPQAPGKSVHPHVRGEYRALPLTMAVSSGSSPRAWGILFLRPLGQGGRRFIPTCVGTTIYCRKRDTPDTVHPHVRGEYIIAAEPAADCTGSSPRAWGIRFWMASSSFLDSVHPHVRGEYRSANRG